MTEVRTRQDCGNSPKNLLLQDLTVALARADVRESRSYVVEFGSAKGLEVKAITSYSIALD